MYPCIANFPTLYLLHGFQGGSNRITVPLDGIPRENGDGTMRNALYTGPTSLHRYVQRAWRLDTALTTTGNTKTLKRRKSRPVWLGATLLPSTGSCTDRAHQEGGRPRGSPPAISKQTWSPVSHTGQRCPSGASALSAGQRIIQLATTWLNLSCEGAFAGRADNGELNVYTSVNKTASTTFTDHANRTHYEPRGSLHYRRRGGI